jgi:DNA adenine methylase
LASRNNDTSEPTAIRPFLSWAGSKRKLIKHLLPYVPHAWNKYYEPFLGGGSLFFYLTPARAEISDASPSLIETYHAVRREPDQILKFLRPLKPDRDTFDRLKAFCPTSSSDKAAQFIFLNKACWNGLFRVNSMGIFNVPYGRPKSDFIVDESNFLKCSAQLRRRSITISAQDFEAISDRVYEGDFIFLDPPYVTSHNVNGFADWNEALFSWKDQVRLAAMATVLVRKGANLLITNADHPDIHRLYRGFGSSTFARSSTLAGNIARRTKTSEAIFFGGPAYKTLSDGPFVRGTNGNDRKRPTDRSKKALAESR